MTVRRVFYICTTQGVVEKSEGGYRKIQYQLRQMRLNGSVPFEWIADNSRFVNKPRMFQSPLDALDDMQGYYRKDLWSNQDVYVEIWVEKDALSGVLQQVTRPWGVPLYPARGFSSLTFNYEAAETIKRIGKPAFIYHLGDYDKWGEDAGKAIARDLKETHGADVTFQRVAVTEAQIKQYNLPTRPAKKGDNREFAVELDAMPTPILRQIVQDCITRHVDTEAWAQAKRIENAERTTLRQVVDNFRTTTWLAG